MYDAKRIIGVTGRAVAIMLVAINSATVLSSGAFAAEPAAASPKVRELATQLAKEWLKEQGVAEPAAGSPAQQTNNSLDDYANSSLDAIQDQVVALARAIPDLPNQFKRAVERITAIDADSGRGQVFLDLGIFGDPYYIATRRLAAEAHALLNLALFGAFAFGAQWLFGKMTEGVGRRLDGHPMDTANDRLRVITTRFTLALGVIAAFVLGSFVPLLARDWDQIRRAMVLGFLIVFVAIWAAIAIGELLFAPNNERFRIIPMDTATARFWYWRLTVFAGWFAFVWVVIQECGALNFSDDGAQVVAYTLGLSIVAIALESVWRKPIAPTRAPEHPQPKLAISGGLRSTLHGRSALYCCGCSGLRSPVS